MQILPLNFLLYTISGLWRPIKWSSKCSKLLYSMFTFSTIYLLSYLMLTHLLYIIFVIDNVEDFASTSPFFFSTISLMFKAITAVIYRDRIVNTVEILQKEPCKACDQDETNIQMKFDHTIRSYSIYYLLLCTFSATGAVTAGMLDVLEGQLPYNMWVPWDCTSFLLFLFTSLQEIVSLIVATIVNIATETIVLGFCLQLCAQFEILEHRLQRMVKSREEGIFPKSSLNKVSHKISKLSMHISHHLCIIRLAGTINGVYSKVIFVQFFVSILVLCSIVYHLSSHLTLTDVATLIVYTFSMFVQIFIYCWAGNTVMLKVTTAMKTHTLYANMQMFSLNFLMYTIGGVWMPIEWSSNIAKLLYNVFTTVILILLYFLMITQFMDIVFVVDNIDDFATNTLMFLTIVAVTCKATIVVVRRKAIINLVQVLLTAPCKPRNEDEMTIQTKFDKFIKSCSIKYSLLATSSVTGVTVRSVLNAIQGQLPYRVWLPYDFNVSPMFWITSIQQIITVIFVTIINVGTETLVFGLFLQTCAQFEIFESRLKKLVTNKTNKLMKNKITYLEHSSPSSNKEKAIISKYIHHHLKIYKYARTVNAIFNQVLFVQFFGSILVLCTSVYYLSAHSTLSETATLIVYTICMFVQVYVYCWSGNEVILKSMSVGDAIYDMNWPSLSVNERKELLMIMLRSTLPMKFTSSFLITLSLQSYSSVLLIVDNIDDFATNTLMFLTIVAVCCKATIVVIRRNAINNLIQLLMETPCKPRDEDEIAIKTKFDIFIRSCLIKYMLLSMSSLTGVTIGSVVNIMQGYLPYRIWLPFNHTIPLAFWTISIHQIVTLIFATMINVSTDILVLGLFLHTCAQFEIFESRLHKLVINKSINYLGNAVSSLNKDKTEISECIRHHLSIYKYAKTVNVIFNQVLFVQFFASILVLCTSVYYLSIHIRDFSGILPFLVYTIGMFVQIYIYCWSGNEVILKSMSIGDAVYCMDWPLLSVNEKKQLLMVMVRSTIPIKFTSSFLITVSLQSYSSILKLSYSAFNILQK
ncbi:PREDICTED: uncharacterized protein LOC108756126 [Trachymyrmex septentrionalis]|uniref:uncharacterized protein LOC108756126 n=1 Tax=Trachymyrmex septentrionalis TaxID=34720 RepID=UPI00084EF316|nr:PREDICTED: uncharacterized protein LOC108756126 [Trachymyrmex septentrionalis]